MNNTSHNRKKKSSAQAMVEFALALPILLLVVYGLLETGRLIFIYASVVTAARQAARYGSATGVIGSGSTLNYYDDCDGIKAAAKRVAFIQPFTSIDISYDNGQNGTWNLGACPIPANSGHPQNGDRIKVTVRADYSPIVPLVPFTAFPIISESNRTLLVGADITVQNPSQGFNGGTPSGLVLGKTGTPQSYTSLGERITYTFTLQNTGTLPIIGPFQITDDKIGTFECTGSGVPSTLPAGSSVVTCNPVYYYITVGDLTSPEVTNHASATALGSNVISSGAVYTVSFLPQPQITLTKTGTPPAQINPGQPILYQFVLLNSGNTPLSPPYSISDTLIGSNWSCPSTPAQLPTNSSVTCTGSYALKSADIHNGSVSNTATASAYYIGTQVTSAPDTAKVPTPPLGLALSANPSSVNTSGTVVTYTYTLTNYTTSGMTNITVTDSRGANNLFCLGSLGAGQTGTCQHTYTVTQNDLNLTSFTNSATASAKPNVGSNMATVDVQVSNLPQLTLTKTVANLTKSGNYYVPPTGQPGFTLPTTLTYNYSFQNTGNVTLSAPFTVTDDKLGTVCTIPTGTLAPGATGQLCTVNYSLTNADLLAGSLTNNATVTGFYNQVAVPGKASATVITFTGPRLGISKTVSQLSYTAAGQTVKYTYNLVNTGGEALTVNSGYALTDSKIGTITCLPIGPLPVGASALCNEAPYLITPADVLAASVTNDVSATAGSTTVPATTATADRKTIFMCPPANLTGAAGTFATPQQQYDWLIANSAILPVYIASLTVSWTSGGVVQLQQAVLNNVTIYTGSDTSGSLTLPEVPAGSWSLGSVKNDLHLAFSGTASGVSVSITILGCNWTLSSN